MSLWNSSAKSFDLFTIGAEMVVYDTFNPYLMSLIKWYTAIYEESEALIHSLMGMNKLMQLMININATHAEFVVVVLVGCFAVILFSCDCDGGIAVALKKDSVWYMT
jgi:hypothetical protein